MSVTISYPFDNPNDYVYDSDKIEITGGKASLKLDDQSLSYPIDNPYLTLGTVLRADFLISIMETSSVSGSDSIKYNVIKDSVLHWLNPETLEFEESDGTFLQSNTLLEIQEALPAFQELAFDLNLRIYFHSEDGQTTPELSNLSITYDIAGDVPDEVVLCEVVIDLFNPDGDPSAKIVKIELVNDVVQYKDNVTIRKERYILVPDAAGRVNQKLVDTVNMALDSEGEEQRYKVTIGSQVYYINVPEQSLAYFWDLIVTA